MADEPCTRCGGHCGHYVGYDKPNAWQTADRFDGKLICDHCQRELVELGLQTGRFLPLIQALEPYQAAHDHWLEGKRNIVDDYHERGIAMDKARDNFMQDAWLWVRYGPKGFETKTETRRTTRERALERIKWHDLPVEPTESQRFEIASLNNLNTTRAETPGTYEWEAVLDEYYQMMLRKIARMQEEVHAELLAAQGGVGAESAEAE